MKKRCYAKYSYVSNFSLAVIMLILSLAPLLIWPDDDSAYKMIWSISMFSFCVFFCIIGIHHMQFYYFEDGYLIVKSAFGMIVKLDSSKSVAYIETLPTYSSWAVSIEKKWICIYDKSIASNFLYKFKSGCANRKKYQRIQIIYSDERKQFIEQYIKISTRNIIADSPSATNS